MPYLTWLADVLRDAGLRVEEIDGWQRRGAGGGMSEVRGVLLHHTAGPANGDFPSRGVLLRGRPDLAGPLCNLGLARDGTWVVVAAGRANHAGPGHVDWCGSEGNPHLIGVEAESTGHGDWTQDQLESYPRGVAALLAHVGLGADRALGHKEWAPRRKIDPAGWPGDMDGFRDTVRAYMEDEMPISDDDIRRIWDFKLNQLDKPEVLHSAAVWLVGANMGAWRAADGTWFDGLEKSAVDGETDIRRFDFARFADANAYQARQEIAGLRAAVEKLAEAVGTAQGLDAAELKKAVSEAIAEAVPQNARG
ncbi:peptidoglycan recognition protein family protein [Allokutzneria oryzae]|uniref:N-acetylmuramoyl-L-alanine amidase n=1 Tax=Allokutzneria oryzae TaxID=1378989 RepID=A0ABV6A8Q9_9PSEU